MMASKAKKCIRCGFCCLTNPCQISQSLAEILRQKYDVKLTPYKEFLRMYRPHVSRGNRICIYLSYPNGVDGKARCLLMRFKEFRDTMLTGDCDATTREWIAYKKEGK